MAGSTNDQPSGGCSGAPNESCAMDPLLKYLIAIHGAPIRDALPRPLSPLSLLVLVSVCSRHSHVDVCASRQVHEILCGRASLARRCKKIRYHGISARPALSSSAAGSCSWAVLLISRTPRAARTRPTRRDNTAAEFSAGALNPRSHRIDNRVCTPLTPIQYAGGEVDRRFDPQGAGGGAQAGLHPKAGRQQGGTSKESPKSCRRSAIVLFAQGQIRVVAG